MSEECNSLQAEERNSLQQNILQEDVLHIPEEEWEMFRQATREAIANRQVIVKKKSQRTYDSYNTHLIWLLYKFHPDVLTDECKNRIRSSSENMIKKSIRSAVEDLDIHLLIYSVFRANHMKNVNIYSICQNLERGKENMN